MENGIVTYDRNLSIDTPIFNLNENNNSKTNSLHYIFSFFEELNFQKLGNSTYNDMLDHILEYIWDFMNQLRKLDLQKIDNKKMIDISEFINQSIQNACQNENKSMPTYYNNDIMSISETNAANYIKNDSDLAEPLLKYTNKIKEYLRVLGKHDDVFIMLQDTNENQDFQVITINIKTEFSDLDEKLDLYDKIGDILNNITDKLAADNGEDIYDKLEMVTYSIEENR